MSFLASKGGFWPLTAFMSSEVKNNYTYVITQDICNKFIEIKISVDVWFGRIHLKNIDEKWRTKSYLVLSSNLLSIQS